MATMTKTEIAKRFLKENGDLPPVFLEAALAQLIHNMYIIGVHDTAEKWFWQALPTEVNIDEELLFP